jgi:hypothetical protein
VIFVTVCGTVYTVTLLIVSSISFQRIGYVRPDIAGIVTFSLSYLQISFTAFFFFSLSHVHSLHSAVRVLIGMLVLHCFVYFIANFVN